VAESAAVSPSAASADLGVYVHYPWCRALCPYCDFPVAVARHEPPHDEYLAAVLAELAERAPMFAGRRLVSIYLGGGTPSLWRPDNLATLIAAVARTFGADPASLEITLEANPTDCEPGRLAAWRAAGIDRLSIGVQSLVPDELALLGRDHRQGDGAVAIAAALAAGFGSLSADLILGVPTGAAGAEVDLPTHIAQVATSGVDHVSVYELTIEDRTAFGRRAKAGTLVPLPDERLAALYVGTHERLTGLGFEHYEVSSYARPGRRAVHNSLYWRGADFLGLGVGAASFWRGPDGGGRRWSNLRQVPRYLRATGPGRVAETTELGADEVATDGLWLAMRTSDGIPEDRVPAATADRLVADGLAERRAGRICPTLRGFLFANQVAARLVAAQPRRDHAAPTGEAPR
jgi:putative oxygen-independent coproporphyrinogen III oxidase